MKSTLCLSLALSFALSGLKAGTCSELILSAVFIPVLKGGVGHHRSINYCLLIKSGFGETGCFKEI